MKASGQRWNWLRVDRLLGQWGIPNHSPAGRRPVGQVMEERHRQKSPQTNWKAIERGWCLGDEELTAELLAQVCWRQADYYGELFFAR